ncbi:MAG: hypothetical protein AAF703_16420 [Cyanobacteria bacterium P01_D01_bin.105]
MELTNKINDTETYSSIAADCTQLMDKQVATKGGLSGVAFKATYKVVKGIGADYIPGAITRLLPEALKALDPIWEEGKSQGDPVSYLSEHSDRTADLILSTTDARIAGSGNGLIAGSYKKLRKSIKPDVAAAVPGLAAILAKHTS